MNILFTHKFDIPIFVREVAKIVFAISTKIPLPDNFPLTERKKIKLFRKDKYLFQSAKLAMAELLASLLRLTAAPCAYWSPFSAFTHNVCNVMRGHRLSLRHSVKHYETIEFCRVITYPFLRFDCKIKHNF